MNTETDNIDNTGNTCGGGVDGYDPQQALADAQATRAALAERAAAPGYYYPVLGVASAIIVGSVALVPPIPRIAVLIVAAAICSWLIHRYQRTTGLWVVYGGSTGKAKIFWAVYALCLTGLVGGAFAVEAWGPSWLGWVLAAGAFVLAMVAGRFIEPALRDEIASGRTSVRVK